VLQTISVGQTVGPGLTLLPLSEGDAWLSTLAPRALPLEHIGAVRPIEIPTLEALQPICELAMVRARNTRCPQQRWWLRLTKPICVVFATAADEGRHPPRPFFFFPEYWITRAPARPRLPHGRSRLHTRTRTSHDTQPSPRDTSESSRPHRLMIETGMLHHLPASTEKPDHSALSPLPLGSLNRRALIRAANS